MWDKWESRFKLLGANRCHFHTSKRSGSKAGKSITGAKCLLFFNREGFFNKEGVFQSVKLETIIDKILCLEQLDVTVNEQVDFEYQVKDSESNSFYGTKIGHAIIEFNPTQRAESRGKDKHGPGIILSQVFKLKRHRQ